MSTETGHRDHIPGTHVFTGKRSQMGLRLNRFAYSLRTAENRQAFADDPDRYMDRHRLSEWEKERITERDWKALVEEGGGSIYMLIKVGAVTGDGLTAMGAQQRGESHEEFIATRNVPLRQNM